MDHPQPFDVTVSLLASDLELTHHQGNPASAVEAVREAIEAIPGASWVSVDMAVSMPHEPGLIDRLELVGGQGDVMELPRLRDAIHRAVVVALGSPARPAIKPPTVEVPWPILEAYGLPLRPIDPQSPAATVARLNRLRARDRGR